MPFCFELMLNAAIKNSIGIRKKSVCFLVSCWRNPTKRPIQNNRMRGSGSLNKSDQR